MPADWLTALRSDLDADHGGRIATLATVDGIRPQARSVVVRGLGDDGSITITSDGRSAKNAQLRANPAATVLFWMAKVKRQYRLPGAVAILATADPRRAAQWAAMGDAARALFAWPSPGQPRDDAAPFPPAVPATAPMPASFEVLVLTPAEVETLDLGQTPHLRRRWTPAGGFTWDCVTLNP